MQKSLASKAILFRSQNQEWSCDNDVKRLVFTCGSLRMCGMPCWDFLFLLWIFHIGKHVTLLSYMNIGSIRYNFGNLSAINMQRFWFFLPFCIKFNDFSKKTTSDGNFWVKRVFSKFRKRISCIVDISNFVAFRSLLALAANETYRLWREIMSCDQDSPSIFLSTPVKLKKKRI